MSDDLTILHGDNTQVLGTLAPRSIQCCVTSPPYYRQRNYNIPPTPWAAITYQPMAGLPALTIPAQDVCLGLEETPEAYTAHLVHVMRLVRAALADDGVCWFNIGDSYAASGNRHTGRLDELPEYIDRRAEQHRAGKRKAAKSTRTIIDQTAGVPAKNLLGIPWRVAFALQADGWYLRSDVIWHKPNAMPESVTDRLTKDHEYIFLLAKSERYFFDIDAIAEVAAPGARKFNGKHSGNSDRQDNGRSDPTPIETRQRRTVWSIGTKGINDAHYAPMPEALAELCIKAGSRPGDTVLDPYGGTGTTARTALRLQRRAVSIDLNPDYIDIHDKRLSAVQYEMV